MQRLTDETKRQFTAAEFFAGIGLVRLALEQQGWKVRFANDIDPEKAEMYRHNWPDEDHLVVGDIHDLKVGDVPTCDLFTASFPCNDLSIAGRWEGLNGRNSSAFWGFVQLLQKLKKNRPPLVLLENVVGFLQSHGGRDLEEALRALNDLDYSVDALVLNALHWVPQSRARLFIIARRGIVSRVCAFPTTSDVRPPALARFIAEHQEILWDLRHVPPLPKPARSLFEIVEDLPDSDSKWWNNERVLRFLNQMSVRHAEEARRMIGSDAITFATAFRRMRNGKSMAEMRTDGIAGCLRTPRGGSAKQILVKAGRGEFRVRLLTGRECARLQGAPNRYVIAVPENQALFGFGDAVCVPVVGWIAKHVLRPSLIAADLPTQAPDPKSRIGS
jgi:DNA (cytosine-5)-methyltransferase 1